MRNSEGARKEKKYPFKMSRLYVNAATAILAIFMASVTVTNPLLIMLFVLLMVIVCVVTFFFKVRPVFKIHRPGQQEDLGEPMGRRGLFALLVVVIAVIVFPFLLFFSAGSLPPETWFIILASLASGIGISEIMFYIYCKRMFW